MKNIILINFLIVLNLSFAKENEMIFQKTINLRYPHHFSKEHKIFIHSPYEFFFPHLQNNICRIKYFEICFDKNLDKDNKIKVLKKNKKLCSKDGIFQLFLGDLYAYYGNYKTAEKILEGIIKNAKFDTRYHKSSLHEVYINLKKTDKSVELAASQIKDYPDFYGGYLNLAINFARTGNLVESKQFLEEALVLDDKNIVTYHIFTVVSYELEEYDKVHLYYDKAFLLAPLITLRDRASSLCMLDVHIIEKDFDEADAMISQLLESDEDIKDDPIFIELQQKFKNIFKK